MNKIGFVEKIDNKKAVIAITRDSSCGENCTMCGICPSKKIVLVIDTDINISPGDKVKVETNTKHILLSAFSLYILPIIMLIVGYAVGTLYIGLIFMTISFTILFYADKKIAKKNLIKVSKVL